MQRITRSRPLFLFPRKTQQNGKQFSCLLNNKTDNEINLLKSAGARKEGGTGQIVLSSVRCLTVFAQIPGYSTGPVGCSTWNLPRNNPFTRNATNCRFLRKMAPIFAPKVKLNNGYEMPVLGLGTYELKKTKCENAVREALSIGYRHIDTAYLYRNETIIGRVLKQQIEKQQLKREDIFLVTKLWNIHHEPHMVKYACKKQMDSLQVDYIDLYLMHSPIGYKYVDDDALMPHVEDKLQTNDIDYVATYKAMEELVTLGWVRSLGLSNFNIKQMQRILNNCSIKPVTNQIECHPGLNQRKQREFCSKHNIIVTAYSPLARPKPTKPLPAFYAMTELHQMAEKYKKTKPQIILRYLIDIGAVPIPKSATPERLLENINIFDFALTKTEIDIISGFDNNTRLWKNEIANFHQYWPFSED